MKVYLEVNNGIDKIPLGQYDINHFHLHKNFEKDEISIVTRGGKVTQLQAGHALKIEVLPF